MNQTSGQRSRYQLLAELGRGGMANVYLAVTEGLGGAFSKLVVLKMMRDPLVDDPEFITMFLDEARLAARMNHPNVVQTLEAGVESGQLYLVMEYLDGQALHRVLNRASAKGALDVRTRMAILDDVLSGLHAAHELADFDGTPLNVVHRDVSPHNVFVTYDGEVKVVDFGIAHAKGRVSKTRRGVIKGKATYMAPEQARGGAVDRRTDIFAVGVMLAESLLERRLWGDRSDKEILGALHTGELPLEGLRADGVDRELADVCARALAVDPDERFQTARDMQDALAPVIARLGGRPSRRDVGRIVAQLFEDRRALTRELVEQQLASRGGGRPSGGSGFETISALARKPKLVEGAGGESPTRILDDLPRGPQESSPDTQSGTRETVSAPTETSGPGAVSAPSTGAGSRARLVRLGAAVGIVVAGAALYFATRAPPTIHVALTASPPEARFRIDDGPELPNPYVGRFPRDGREHRVVARVSGRSAAKEQTVRFDDDVALQIVLAP